MDFKKEVYRKLEESGSYKEEVDEFFSLVEKVLKDINGNKKPTVEEFCLAFGVFEDLTFFHKKHGAATLMKKYYKDVCNTAFRETGLDLQTAIVDTIGALNAIEEDLGDKMLTKEEIKELLDKYHGEFVDATEAFFYYEIYEDAAEFGATDPDNGCRDEDEDDESFGEFLLSHYRENACSGDAFCVQFFSGRILYMHN